MDKILGIIAEYNPFHNGHLYHLEKSKQLTGCNSTIAIISGNFTQRGSTSLVDKWKKTKMALLNGIDLVIELPTLYSISSAENFADGSIKILNSLGVVDFLSFGAETVDINLLNNISNILYDEPETYKTLLSNELKKGLPFPKARENALLACVGNSNDYLNILSSPNNILAIEYLKALKKYKSSIIPLTIKRDYSDYNSKKVKNGIASSTAIRTMIENKKNIHYVVPFETYELMEEQINSGHINPNLAVFEKEIIYNLRKMPIQEIANLPDVSEGLEYRIKEAANISNTLETLISHIKTKRYTLTRIQRILLHSLLGITTKDINASKKVVPYIRILGFNKHGKRIISAIAANNPSLKIIVSLKKFMENNSNNTLRNMISKDILATNIYTLGYKSNDGIANLDYTHKIIDIK